LGLWFVFPIKGLFSKPGYYLARYLILACGLTAAAFLFTRPSTLVIHANTYNSLFYGVLVYSRDAPARLFVVLFILGSHKAGFIEELALLGLLTSVAMMCEIGVAVIGEGRADIYKHLFLANYLFDLSAIAAVNTSMMFVIKKSIEP
jgi:hypothetical protein